MNEDNPMRRPHHMSTNSPFSRRSALALTVGTVAGVVAFLVFGIAVPVKEHPARDAYFYIALFKLFVGICAYLFTFYALYGHEFHRHGIAEWMMPPVPIPPAVAAVYFTLGTVALLSSFRVFTGDTSVELTGMVLAWILAFAVAVGYAAYSYRRACDRAERNGER